MHDLTHRLGRRTFLEGTAACLTGIAAAGAFPSLTAAGPAHAIASKRSTQRVVIYQERAHFDERASLQIYVPPADPASGTRAYLSQLSEHEFLSRHWFA